MRQELELLHKKVRKEAKALQRAKHTLLSVSWCAHTIDGEGADRYICMICSAHYQIGTANMQRSHWISINGGHRCSRFDRDVEVHENGDLHQACVVAEAQRKADLIRPSPPPSMRWKHSLRRPWSGSSLLQAFWPSGVVRFMSTSTSSSCFCCLLYFVFCAPFFIVVTFWLG